jgi:IS1 family transposase
MWLIKAFNRGMEKTIAMAFMPRVFGGRDSATFRQLYEKVKDIPHCT